MTNQTHTAEGVTHTAEGATPTENEYAVLQSLAFNHYGDGGSDVWSWAVNDSQKPSGLTGKTLSGVVASICKKGLYTSHSFGKKDDDFLGRTALGDKVVEILFPESR